MKGIYEHSTVNIIFNGEIQNTFPLGSKTRQRYLFSPFIFSIVWETRKTYRTYGLKGRYKTVFTTDNMIMYTENPKYSADRLLELIKEFSIVVGQRSIYKNQVFLYTSYNFKIKMKKKYNLH